MYTFVRFRTVRPTPCVSGLSPGGTVCRHIYQNENCSMLSVKIERYVQYLVSDYLYPYEAGYFLGPIFLFHYESMTLLPQFYSGPSQSPPWHHLGTHRTTFTAVHCPFRGTLLSIFPLQTHPTTYAEINTCIPTVLYVQTLRLRSLVPTDGSCF